MRRLLLVIALILLPLHLAIRPTRSHGDHGDEHGSSCEMSEDTGLAADFRPGAVTLDGHPEEWSNVDGTVLDLLPALDPDDDRAYDAGKMVVKALHDGSNIYFMLQVDGEYAYKKGENNKCPSVALMFPIGENASYHNMGGCKDMPGSCTNTSCRGREVDIMHFSIGNAVPGRLYGGNPVDNAGGTGDDRFGHLVDLYAWNPHCRYLDGKGPAGRAPANAQNDWRGTWWHSSLASLSGFVEEDSPYATIAQKGTYYFEFSRPLRTMDRLQQDVQFSVGQPSKMAVAFWYPKAGNPWTGSQHYSVSCNWLPLSIDYSKDGLSTHSPSSNAWDATTAFSLLLSTVAFCLSIFVGYKVLSSKSVPFAPIENL